MTDKVTCQEIKIEVFEVEVEAALALYFFALLRNRNLVIPEYDDN